MASNDELYNIFAATLSADKIQRQPAEDALQQLASTNPEFILQLMHFCSQYIAEDVLASNALHRSILLAAAIRFRNLISRCNWNRNTQQAWTEEVRSAVRQQLVPAQCAHHVGELIRRQLLSATTDLISYDYPSRWPEMVSQLHLIISDSMKTLEALDRVAPTADSTRSQAEALLRLKGALGVLRQCCKVYSEPQKVTEAEVEAFATSHAPSLISLMELLLTLWEREAKRTHDAESINGHPPTGGVLSFSPLFGELSHCIRLAIKCFVSLCHTRWPQYLCDGNVLQQFWAVCVQKPRHVMEQYIMPLCKARLEASMHEPGRATAERGDHFEDFQESPGWRVLKWSGALALKVTQEFISPKSCEKRARVAAQLFADNLMEPTAVSALELIRWHCADGQPLTSKAYIMAIEVLTILVSHKPTYLTVIHANAEELMTVLLFPRLSFSAEDEELWNSNPEEYVRRQSSPAGDLFNPKVVSSSLLLSLAVPSKKFHDGQLVFSLVNFLLNQLQAYSREAAAVTEEEPFSPRTIAARRVDAAMYCLCQFKAVMKLMNFGDDKIEYVLLTYAVPATQYPLGYLRCRAVLLISTYASGIQWSSPTTFQTVLQSVLPLLNDPDTCVQVQTCMSFSRLSTHPYAKEVIIPCIAQLIQQYFQVMRLMDNESVVRTLRKTITAYRDTLSQWALELTDMIVAHFTSVVSNVTGKYAALESTNPEAAADFMNCDAGEDDGLADALMAADELLDTITTLVHSLPPSTATATSSPAEIQQDMFVQLQMRVSPLLLLVLGQSNSSTSFGFMDPMLNLITTLLARSPAVAPPTWALVPCFHHLVTMRGSTDYIHELLAPLDNFCSVEPLHFTATAMSGLCELPAGAENFVSWTPAQIVLHFCESVWANDSLRQRELSAIPRLYESVLQNYWSVLRREVSGRSRPAGDPLTPQPIAATLIMAVVQQAVGAMLHRPQSAATLHVLLANAVLSCLLADPASTVQCFQLEQHRSLGGVSLDDFLRRYAELCSTSAAGKASSHLRMYDRHLLVLSVGEAIRFLAVEQQQGRWNEGCDALHGALNHLVGSTYLLGEYANADAREAEERIKTIHKRISKTTAKKSKEAAAAAVADDDDDDDEWASETDEETCSTVDLNALNDEEEEDWMGDDDDDDNLGDDGGKFQALLQQAQSMRKGGDGHSGHHHIDPQEGAANVEDEMETIEEDDEEEDLLAGDEFDSPIDNINVWDVLSNALSGGSSLPIAVLMTGDTSFQQQLAAMASASTLVTQLYSAEAQLMQVMRD